MSKATFIAIGVLEKMLNSNTPSVIARKLKVETWEVSVNMKNYGLKYNRASTCRTQAEAARSVGMHLSNNKIDSKHLAAQAKCSEKQALMALSVMHELTRINKNEKPT